MKTAIKAALFVLGIAAIVLFFFLQSIGPTDSARLVSSDAIAYVSFPDSVRFQRRWQNAALQKIYQEPSVKAFLQKPISQLGELGMDEVEKLLTDLRPTQCFIAVEESSKTSYVSWYGGIQFFGNKGAVDAILNQVDKYLTGHSSAGSIKRITSDYQGTQIIRTDYQPLPLFSAIIGHWLFFSTDEVAIHSALDRVQGRAKSPHLADSREFQLALKRLAKDSDVIGYIRLQPLIDQLLARGEEMGAKIIPEQAEQLRAFESISFSEKLDGTNFRDVLFVKGDFKPLDLPVLQHRGLDFAPENTLLYFETVTAWKQGMDILKDSPMEPFLKQSLKHLGISTEEIPALLGSEVNLSVSWPEGDIRPELLLSAPLANIDRMKSILDTIFQGDNQVKEERGPGGVSFVLPPLNAIVQPVIGITDHALLLGMGKKEVSQALTLQPKQSLSASPRFQSVKSIFNQPNDMLMWIDTASLFDRTYMQFQPVIIFGAAIIPQVSQFIDTTKLPPSRAISSLLDPITYTSRRTSDGYLMESRGPITLHQAFLLGLAGASIWRLQN